MSDAAQPPIIIDEIAKRAGLPVGRFAGKTSRKTRCHGPYGFELNRLMRTGTFTGATRFPY
jgi:hypothetical protein